MLPVEQARSEKLHVLASKHPNFPNLRPIERQVLAHSCMDEDPADWTLPEAERSPTGRPFPSWRGDEVRVSLIQWLLTDKAAADLLGRGGLRLWNVRLAERLDLSSMRILTSIRVRYCLVEAPLVLVGTTLPRLTIRNSTLLQGLDATNLELDGPLYFEDLTAAHTLCFDGAAITARGQARFNEVTLTGTGTALSMEDATIENDLFLGPNLQSSGKLSLRRIKVRRDIILNAARLTTTEQALDLDDAKIEGSVFLTEGFLSIGQIRMVGTEIGHKLDFTGARLTANKIALRLDGARIGQLDCSGATFIAGEVALSLDEARIAGNVRLSCTVGKDAVNFRADGLISMKQTEIGGQLNCGGATLTSKDEALVLDKAKIHQGIFLDKNFASAGTIRAVGAEIDEVRCEDASLGPFLGEKLEIKGDFYWTGIKKQEHTLLNLKSAQVRAVYFDLASLPKAGSLHLKGITLQELVPLEDRRLHTVGRIAWLNCQPDANLAEPEPWLHMARLLESKGYKRDARRLLFELYRHEANAQWKSHRIRRWLRILFARLEEQPFRILWPILVLATLSGTIFDCYQSHFAPTNEAAYKINYRSEAKCGPSPNFQTFLPVYDDDRHTAKFSQTVQYVSCNGLPVAYPRFQPFIYALENVLPVVKLGQDDHWAPTADIRYTSITLYWFLMIMRWFLILAGYVQGAVLAAAVSARFRT